MKEVRVSLDDLEVDSERGKRVRDKQISRVRDQAQSNQSKGGGEAGV